jgi:cold shock CspA family protein
MEHVRWTGIVARFNHSKGYGFVAADNADEGDVFLHQSEWHDPLPVARGMRVSFKIGRDPRGRLRAKAAKAL